MKTKFASKVIMFDKLLKFKEAIFLCYGQQRTLNLQQKVLEVEVWELQKHS